jgi:hypothetical protein
MLTFKQYLNEVLNNPYKWELDAQNTNPHVILYKFKTDSGLEYEVQIGRSGRGKLTSKDWELSFNIDSNYLEKIGKRVLDAFKLSGTGNQFRIFATVQDIVKDFIIKHAPDLIAFSAAEPSRRRLYSTFTANFEKSQPELFKTYIAWSIGNGADSFIMKRDFAKKVLNGQDDSYFYKIIPSEYRDELR